MLGESSVRNMAHEISTIVYVKENVFLNVNCGEAENCNLLDRQSLSKAGATSFVCSRNSQVFWSNVLEIILNKSGKMLSAYPE